MTADGFKLRNALDDICLEEKTSTNTHTFSCDENVRFDGFEAQIVIPERAKWSTKLDFVLSAVGYAVGFGNVWRFPYLCYSNGGGAFLIPYFIMMTLAGLPLFYLELALGQYASLGPVAIWKVCPVFTGLGYAMMGLNLLVSVYYNVILALSIFYFISSLTPNLPWASCDNLWNKNCSLDSEHLKNVQGHTALENITNFNPFPDNSSTFYSNLTTHKYFNISFTNINISCPHCLNESTTPTTFELTTSYTSTYKSPAEEFWLYYVLGVDDNTNIAHIGQVRWHLTLCNLLAWVVVLLCIVKGIKTSGKVVYFTATFPYVVLIILFIRGISLPGAFEGIKFYLVPDFSKMASVQVWNDAAIQILFSLGPGFGSLIMLGSYNKFHNRCDRDAVLITLINCFTSVFAGFVIFSVLGFISLKRGVAVAEVVDKGPGLAFIAYPEALSMMPGAPFWSICFFFMLFTLGLDSQFVGVESIVTGLMDIFPVIERWKKLSTSILCAVLFLVGLPCITQGGMFVLELIDQFTTSFPLLLVTFLEAITIGWIYGLKRFSKNLELMLGVKPNYYWMACWIIITPTIIIFIFAFKCVGYNGLHYGQYKYPSWAEGIGWLIVSFLVGVIPLMAVWKFLQCIGSFQNFWWVVTLAAPMDIWKLHHLWTPEHDWGPMNYKENKIENAILEAINHSNNDEINSSARDFVANMNNSLTSKNAECKFCREAGRTDCVCCQFGDSDGSCFVVSLQDEHVRFESSQLKMDQQEDLTNNDLSLHYSDACMEGDSGNKLKKSEEYAADELFKSSNSTTHNLISIVDNSNLDQESLRDLQLLY